MTEAEERQEALYSFLSGKDTWVSMREAAAGIGLYPPFFSAIYHNSAARRMLTADIEAVNNSDRYEKTIISGSRGIKLATEDEFESFIAAELAEIFKKLKRIRKLIKKGGKNRQIDIEGRIAEAFKE